MFIAAITETADGGLYRLGEVILLVFAVAGAFVTMTKVPIKRWQAWLQRNRRRESGDRKLLDEVIPQMAAAHKDTQKLMGDIMAELKPNHGTSLRDAIDRIDSQSARNGALVLAFLDIDERAMYIMDNDVNMTWCNHAYTKLVGRDSKDLLGKGFWSTVVPEDLPRLMSLANTYSEEGIANVVEFSLQMAGGMEPVRASSHTFPLKDEQGRHIGTIGYLEAAKSQVKETTVRLEAVVNPE